MRPPAVYDPSDPCNLIKEQITQKLRLPRNMFYGWWIAIVSASVAWLRAPAVRAAREQLEAARTGYRQSTDLGDLVALYRSFLRATNTRVGPEKSRRATASIAPSPNVDALSGELVAKNVAIAFEQLRRAVRDIVAASERAHADAARLAGARRILKAEVNLYRSLVAVLQARLASGKSTQAALLAFQSRLVAWPRSPASPPRGVSVECHGRWVRKSRPSFTAAQVPAST